MNPTFRNGLEWHGYPIPDDASPDRPWWRSYNGHWNRSDGGTAGRSARTEALDIRRPMPCPPPLCGQVWRKELPHGVVQTLLITAVVSVPPKDPTDADSIVIHAGTSHGVDWEWLSTGQLVAGPGAPWAPMKLHPLAQAAVDAAVSIANLAAVAGKAEPFNLQEIKARAAEARKFGGTNRVEASADDVPALVAEVERLAAAEIRARVPAVPFHKGGAVFAPDERPEPKPAPHRWAELTCMHCKWTGTFEAVEKWTEFIATTEDAVNAVNARCPSCNSIRSLSINSKPLEPPKPAPVSHDAASEALRFLKGNPPVSAGLFAGRMFEELSRYIQQQRDRGVLYPLG